MTVTTKPTMISYLYVNIRFLRRLFEVVLELKRRRMGLNIWNLGREKVSSAWEGGYRFPWRW